MEMMAFYEKVKTFPQAISQGNAFNFPKKQATQMSGIRCKSDNFTKILIKNQVSPPKDTRKAGLVFCVLEQNPFEKILGKT